MASAATRTAAGMALLAAIPMLAGCAEVQPYSANTSGRLPGLGNLAPRMRAPSAERPPWLAPPPVDPLRLPAPEFGFRA